MNTNELNEQNVTQWLLDYNNDLEIRNLRETYNHPSFFEMMDKDRSETVHSAFLRWLLKSDDFNIGKGCSPLMIFLDLLIRRAQVENKHFDPTLKNAILSRNIVFKSIKVETEQNVGDLAKEKSINSNVTITDFDKVFNSKDRIDIYVECEVENVKGCEKLQIIIENKVGSPEGCEKGALIKSNKSGCKKYDDSKQTERYYLACQYEEKNLKQLFVYLTPLSSILLDDYGNLEESYKCSCPEYIQINYQDVLDYIIIPLMESPFLPERSRVFLNEYQSTLTIPAIALIDENQDAKKSTRNLQKYLVMACSLKEKEKLVSFLQKHQNLLYYSLCVANNSIYDDDSNLRCVFKVFLDELKEHCKNREDSDVKLIVDNWNYCFKRIIEINNKGQNKIELGKNHIEYCYKKINDTNKTVDNIDFSQNAEILGFHSIKLLRDFYQQNYRLIIAALKILVDTTNKDNELSFKPDEFVKWQDLYEQLSNSTDHTKYTLSIDGNAVNAGKAMGKRELVRKLVENLKISQNDIDNIDNSSILYEMNSGIKTTMFIKSFPADICRYDGVTIENNKNNVEPLKDDTKKYDFYVSNQWGVLNDGKGNFNKLLDFFVKNTIDGQIVKIVSKSNNN